MSKFAPTTANFATFNSVYFTKAGDAFHVVATNGKAIAVCELTAKIQAENSEDVKLIIPTESIKKLESSLNGLEYDGEIMIQATNRRIKFIAGECSFILNLMNGTYPDYLSLLPTKMDNYFHTNPMHIKGVVERSIIFDVIEGVYPVRFKKTGEGLNVSGEERFSGTYEDTLEVDMSNCDNLNSCYNARYIIDALSVQNGIDCKVNILDNNAFFVRSKTKQDLELQCMVMPLRWG